MPDGFRGNAAHRYLTDVENALQAAHTAHNQDPFSALGNNPLQPLPFIPNQGINITNTYPSHTAHLGGHSLGVNSSSNIVSDRDRYGVVMQRMLRFDRDMEGHVRSVSNLANKLCQVSYQIPQTTPRVVGILRAVINSLTSFTSPTRTINTQTRAYAQELTQITG